MNQLDENTLQESQPYTNSQNDRPPGDMPNADHRDVELVENEDHNVEADAEELRQLKRKEWLLAKASEIYTTSTDYMDANITNRWEENLAHFNNEHAPGSKINKSSVKARVFRPKTRTMTKSAEAALTNAMFSTTDVVDIQPQDPTNIMQITSGKIVKELLQHRLGVLMKWYLTVIGAYQSSLVYGLCIGFQYWDYDEDTDIVPAIDPETGRQIMDEEGSLLGRKETRVRKDDLCCDLVAPENFRFDPMCDWRDPATSSPYIVYLMPIYAGEVQENMEKADPKTGQPLWMKHSFDEIMTTRRQNFDRTRQAREGRGRVDSADTQKSNAYTTLWAHMNIVKINGDDMVYWTLGTELLLTMPVLLREAFPHLREGERPFTVGFSTIEAFKNYPAGEVEQSASLQGEINLVANQRLDNVRLVLNKRYFVKRGSQVDLNALIRNVPGGGVMMNDPEKDVVTVSTPDITSSSYQEQDRLSTEMDELGGAFSQQSVQQTANRKGGETKGGMDQMKSGAGAVRDYGLKVFVETWVEPTLRQMVRLIQNFETDTKLLALAGKKAGTDLLQFGQDELLDEMLLEDLIVRVNVGMGNTDPQTRIDKLIFGVKSTAELPDMAQKLKSETIADEIFGMLGYKDSSRFYRNEQEQAAWLEQNPPETPAEIQMKQKELEIRENDNKSRHQRELMKLDKEAQLDFARLAIEKDLNLNKMMQDLGIKMQNDKTLRDTSAASNATKLKQEQLRTLNKATSDKSTQGV